MTVVRQTEELQERELETAKRLGRFRGTMCDVDFAQLVKDVLRIRDKSDGRSAVTPFDTYAGTLFSALRRASAVLT